MNIRQAITITLAATALSLGFAQQASAEPTGAVTTLIQLRPYQGSTVYVYPVDPSPCNTPIYTVDISTAAGKAIYATLLSSIVAGKRVQLEVVSCQGLYTPLQSVYIFPT